ncbi:caspase domain-containing protein [Xylaria curta]|nr:caspase domain-containing protein [Xylaria curta]
MDQRLITSYAILIGIDAYPECPLRSCAQDVRDIQNYLEGKLDSLEVHLFTTAEIPDLRETEPQIWEPPACWPSHENVTTALDKVASRAKPGDSIYIHYSGHGTREIFRPYDEFSSESTGDLALVLLDGKDGVRALYGSRLALTLKSMVDKGLVVTLVLDCCFSASFYRRYHEYEPNIRFIPHSAIVPTSSPPSRPRDVPARRAVSSDGGSRDTSMFPSWLISPDGYAVLVACGPHEPAIGFKADDGQMHGVLTYHLLKTLRQSSSGLFTRLGNIHRSVCAMVAGSWPRQNPVLYGNKNQGLFGCARSGTSDASRRLLVCIKRSGQWELQAGQVHGMCVGDQVALIPLGAEADTLAHKANDRVVTSIIHIMQMTAYLKPVSTSVDTSCWTAYPITRFSLRKFPIRLTSNHSDLGELPRALRERSIDIACGTESPYVLELGMGENETYEITRQDGGKVRNLPPLKREHVNPEHLCTVIEHLTLFEQVLELSTIVAADSLFRTTFEVVMIRHEQHVGQAARTTTFLPGSLIDVSHDIEAKYTLELVVKNLGSNNLYLFVYSLGSYFQVENVLRGTYEVIPPKASPLHAGRTRKKLKTSVPRELRERGVHECDDVIAVWVASHPTTAFELLELPKIGSRPPSKAPNAGNIMVGEDVRGLGADCAGVNFRIHTSQL